MSTTIKTNATTGNEAGLIINIPSKIKNIIDAQFSDFSQRDIQKIYFLYYKIASSGNYQVNARNHSWMLGINSGELSTILDRLKLNMLIKGGGNHVEGKLSSSYQVVTSYNFNSDLNEKIFFYESQMNLPIWVQKYMADGYTVKNSKFTSYRKDVKETKLVSISESSTIENEALKAKINELQLEIERLQGIVKIQDEFINQDYVQEMITKLIS